VARLAGQAFDPAILHVMEMHKWQVGTLCELYPEGKVGVSEVCTMGLNQVRLLGAPQWGVLSSDVLIFGCGGDWQNKGQKIFLRIRTDDLKVSPCPNTHQTVGASCVIRRVSLPRKGLST
jgi:hypothetical protein